LQSEKRKKKEKEKVGLMLHRISAMVALFRGSTTSMRLIMSFTSGDKWLGISKMPSGCVCEYKNDSAKVHTNVAMKGIKKKEKKKNL
jgi:hypothetical protein